MSLISVSLRHTHKGNYESRLGSEYFNRSYQEVSHSSELVTSLSQGYISLYLVKLLHNTQVNVPNKKVVYYLPPSSVYMCKLLL